METIEQVNDIAIAHGPGIALGMATIVGSFLIAYLARLILKRLFRKYDWAGRVGNLLAAMIYCTILAMGILIGLSTMGVAIAPIIAGLGLGGFALGFALRDALGNLLAGILIIIYQPLKKGATISVSGCQGIVAETNLRYTILRGEGEQFMVPNSLIFQKPLRIISTNEPNK